MRAVEFTTAFGNEPVVTIPPEVAAKLSKSGRARIIVLTPDAPEDAASRRGAYRQFVREDSPSCSICKARLAKTSVARLDRLVTAEKKAIALQASVLSV
jgi:hypothetical protein